MRDKEDKYVCADCGTTTTQSDGPCRKCKSFRIVLISVVESTFGKDWKSAFEPDNTWQDKILKKIKSYIDEIRKRELLHGHLQGKLIDVKDLLQSIVIELDFPDNQIK